MGGQSGRRQVSGEEGLTAARLLEVLKVGISVGAQWSLAR